MTLFEACADMLGHTLVHADPSHGLLCFWNGSVVFLEYRVKDNIVEHGDAWSTSRRPAHAQDALDIARTHYGLSIT